MSGLIAAVATGGGRSAIGIIRISGDGALSAAARIFRPKRGGSMADAPAGQLVYGELLDAEGKIADLCLCAVFRAPRSYTGEDAAEFHCHGSPAVLALGLESLFAAGARQAEPGEFTKRAFLNGKLDLTEAEAVADLIDAQTAEAARNASGQLAGAVSRKAGAAYSALVDMEAHFHAVVDWPDEDIEPFEAARYAGTLDAADAELSALLDTFSRGRVLRDGVPCAIIGRPNVGKSSLLNALLGYERAIVTDVAGTTRDTVEEKCVVGGVLLRLVDTAGIRRTEDAVEKLGVSRAREAARGAGLVLALVDAAQPLNGEDLEVLRVAESSGKPWLLLQNKIDAVKTAPPVPAGIGAVCAIPVSARYGTGLDRLGAAVGALFALADAPRGEILTNARQADEVRRARDSVRAAAAAIREGVTPDAVLEELEEALSALASLTGRAVREDVLDRIFSRFCVGK